MMPVVAATVAGMLVSTWSDIGFLPIFVGTLISFLLLGFSMSADED